MNTFAKLNLKDQKDVVIENAPASFEREIASLHRFRPTRHRLEIYGLCEDCND